MAWAVLPLMVAPGGLPRIAQGADPAQIRFTYENPKLQPPKYVLTVAEDGTGHFRSEAGGPASNDPQSMPAEPQDQADPHLKGRARSHVCRRAQEQTLRHVLR